MPAIYQGFSASAVGISNMQDGTIGDKGGAVAEAPLFSFGPEFLLGVDFRQADYNSTGSGYSPDTEVVYLTAASNYAGSQEELAAGSASPPSQYPIVESFDGDVDDSIFFGLDGRFIQSTDANTLTAFSDPTLYYVANFRFLILSEQIAGQVIFGFCDDENSDTFFLVGLNHENRVEIRRSVGGAQDTLLGASPLTMNESLDAVLTMSEGTITLTVNGSTIFDAVSCVAESGSGAISFTKMYIGADLRSAPTVLSDFDGRLAFLNIANE